MNRLLTTLALILALVQIAGCKSDECVTDADCPDGRACRLGLCAPSANEADASAANDVVLGCRAAEPGDLLLVEILADPGGVDVNGDGFYDSSDDEFVEFVNVASVPVGLLNVQLRVSGSAVVLDAVCLDPNAAHVHFGSEDHLGLNNTGDSVDLLISGEVVDAHTYGGEGGKQQSLTRAEQLDSASPWVQHLDVSTEPWSPGKCANGAAFPNCANPDSPGPDSGTTDADTAPHDDAVVGPSCDGALPVAGDLLFTEVMFNPGSIDTNGDGVASGTEDEFVELVNVSGQLLDVGGVTFSETGGKSFVLPVGTCLPANHVVILFGKFSGQTGPAMLDGVQVFGATSNSLGLNNAGGDTVTLRAYPDLDGPGVVIDTMTYASGAAASAPSGESLARVAFDAAGPDALFVRHSEAPGSGGAVMSPGLCATGAPFPNCDVPPEPDTLDSVDDAVDGQGTADDGSIGPDADVEAPPACGPAPTLPMDGAPMELLINEIMSDPEGVDHNASGVYDPYEDEYIEVVNATAGPLDLSGVWVLSSGAEFQPLLGCLPPQSGLLIFGAGETSLPSTDKVFVTQNASLEMVNAGGSVSLVLRQAGAEDVEIDQVDYPALSGISWVRDLDGSGPWVAHNEHSEVLGLLPESMQDGFSPNYSPGLCADWSPFASCL
jgi:hypothetical protein